MASSYSERKRLNLQATGDNVSTWGSVQNSGVFNVVDFAMDGWSVIALSADHTLTTADGTTTGNEAGARVLKLTTAAATYITTLPAREAWYIVWNASTAAQTIASSGGGASVSIAAGEVVFVATDAVNVKRLTLTSMGSQRLTNLGAPTADSDGATKKYVDDAAFDAAGGNLPGQSGNAGKFLTTDGSTAGWGDEVASLVVAGEATVAELTTTGAATLGGGATLAGSTKQNVQALVGTSIDASLAEFFTKSISANTTFTFTGAVAGKAQAFLLEVTITSSAVPTWPASVDWAGGATPPLPNGRSLLAFLTLNGGTSWTGIVLAMNVS